jgi:hypothetical protein
MEIVQNNSVSCAIYFQQLNILHSNIGTYRKHVLVWERWFISGAAVISGYIAASGTVGECEIGKDFEEIVRGLIQVASRRILGPTNENRDNRQLR